MKMLIFLAFAILAPFIQPIEAKPASKSVLEQALAEEIKEYHFHIYFFQTNPQSNASAESVYRQINELVEAGFFHPVTNRINFAPRGPHVIGSYEIWCPKEHFSRTYSWLLQHRGALTVFIHPLTREEVKDHTDRVAFMGPSVPIDNSPLTPLLDHVPLQYPELGLGYSAPN